MARQVSLENTRNIGIMAHIDAGLLRLKEFYFIQELIINSARCTMAQPPWTGWFRSRSAELRLLRPQPLVFGMEIV